MAIIPKTVGELKIYLETYTDDTRIFVEDKDGILWYFSVEKEFIEMVNESILYMSAFKVADWDSLPES